MDDLIITISDSQLCKSHTRDRWGNREMRVAKVGDQWRMMVIDARRYILFYSLGPVDPAEPETPPSQFISQLTAEQDGDEMTVDGRKLIVAGFGGKADVTKRASDVVKLSNRVPGMFEVKQAAPNGAMTIRKIGTRYQIFIINGDWLLFFGEKEVGPGFPRATIENKFKNNSDGGTRVVIDQKVYKVGGHGGTATIIPEFFRDARAVN